MDISVDNLRHGKFPNDSRILRKTERIKNYFNPSETKPAISESSNLVGNKIFGKILTLTPNDLVEY